MLVSWGGGGGFVTENNWEPLVHVNRKFNEINCAQMNGTLYEQQSVKCEGGFEVLKDLWTPESVVVSAVDFMERTRVSLTTFSSANNQPLVLSTFFSWLILLRVFSSTKPFIHFFFFISDNMIRCLLRCFCLFLNTRRGSVVMSPRRWFPQTVLCFRAERKS